MICKFRGSKDFLKKKSGLDVFKFITRKDKESGEVTKADRRIVQILEQDYVITPDALHDLFEYANNLSAQDAKFKELIQTLHTKDAGDVFLRIFYDWDTKKVQDTYLHQLFDDPVQRTIKTDYVQKFEDQSGWSYWHYTDVLVIANRTTSFEDRIYSAQEIMDMANSKTIEVIGYGHGPDKDALKNTEVDAILDKQSPLELQSLYENAGFEFPNYGDPYETWEDEKMGIKKNVIKYLGPAGLDIVRHELTLKRLTDDYARYSRELARVRAQIETAILEVYNNITPRLAHAIANGNYSNTTQLLDNITSAYYGSSDDTTFDLEMGEE